VAPFNNAGNGLQGSQQGVPLGVDKNHKSNSFID